MNVAEKRKLLLGQLTESLADLDSARKAIVYSTGKALAIGQKETYDLEEQEVFEALTARFARASDILTQKALKTVFLLLQESAKTNLDAANLAEKLGIVENTDTLINIRELRNQIAHEYVRSDMSALYLEVLRYVPELENVIDCMKSYCKRFHPR